MFCWDERCWWCESWERTVLPPRRSLQPCFTNQLIITSSSSCIRLTSISLVHTDSFLFHLILICPATQRCKRWSLLISTLVYYHHHHHHHHHHQHHHHHHHYHQHREYRHHEWKKVAFYVFFSAFYFIFFLFEFWEKWMVLLFAIFMIKIHDPRWKLNARCISWV